MKKLCLLIIFSATFSSATAMNEAKVKNLIHDHSLDAAIEEYEPCMFGLHGACSKIYQYGTGLVKQIELLNRALSASDIKTKKD